MDNEKAQPWDATESCLFLLPAPHQELNSSDMEEKEIVLVPVATERRYIGLARSLIKQSTAYASSSNLIEKNQEPSGLYLPEMSAEPNQSKLSNGAISEELLQPVAYKPQDFQPSKTSCGKPTSTATLVQTAAENGIRLPAQKLENHDIGSSSFQAVNEKVSPSSAPHQELSRTFSPHSDSDELLLPLVYDPNEHAQAIRSQKDSSKGNGSLLPKYPNLDADVPLGNVYGIDEMGFEGMIRNGLHIDDEILNGNGLYLNDMSQPSEEKIAIQAVNIQQASYNSPRPEVQSVYADVYASNPFSTDFGVQDDGDLSTRATLFPSKALLVPDFSGLECVVLPERPSKSFRGSLPNQTKEDDLAAVTKDFHHALSLIAMEKPHSALPNFGLPAKAMSILGQAERMKDVRACGKVENCVQKQLSPLGLVSDLSSEQSNGSRSLRSDSDRLQKQLFKEVPVALAKRNGRSFTNEDHILLSRPAKLQSILGTNISAPAANIPSPISELSQNEPRSSSTLYEKLFSQLLKPSGITEHGGNNFRPSSIQGRFDGEPVKRSSLSSSNGHPPCRMPFGSSGLGYYDKVTRQGSTGKFCHSSSDAANSQSKKFRTQGDVTIDRPSLRDSTNMPSNFHKELMRKSGDSTDDDSRKSPVLSPYKQFQRLASALDSTSTATNLDQGLSSSRPSSPVKKMFSSTVEKIGRMIPVSNNANSLHNSHETATGFPPGLKTSIHPADQNRLFGDLEYIIQDTANRFLLYQHSHSRLSPQSIEKTARIWHQKNRPQVAQFLYPISVQRKLVEQNLDTIAFHGPLAGNTTAINAVMHTWKYVAQELGIRSFCLPDAGLQHFLREAARLLELLGVTTGHMLHFQAWNNIVCRTVHANYQTPYSLHGKSFE